MNNAKFATNQAVTMIRTGGEFCVMGGRWSEAMSEYVYEVREIKNGRHGAAMNFVESMLVAL